MVRRSLDLSTRWRWVVSFMLRPLHSPAKDLSSFIGRESGWALRPVWSHPNTIFPSRPWFCKWIIFNRFPKQNSVRISCLYVQPIFIIWHYNPLWVFAFSAKSLHVLLSLAVSFQFLIFCFFRSSMTSSCHRCLGLPTGLVPIGFQPNSFLVGLAWSIRWICPSHLILCAFMNLTISAPSINLSISMLFRILHTLSILTGPNIFLNICLPNTHSLSYTPVFHHPNDTALPAWIPRFLFMHYHKLSPSFLIGPNISSSHTPRLNTCLTRSGWLPVLVF